MMLVFYYILVMVMVIQNYLRDIIKRENIDALFLITDPRYFEWLFAYGK